MVQIPDSIRPHLEFVGKYHFWLLIPLVPLILLPVLLLTNGKLAAEIASRRSDITSRIKAMSDIDAIEPHPNDSWATDLSKRTVDVKQETLREWQRFWDSQESLRVWPAELGPDFLQRVRSLKPEGKLPRPLLERYQNMIRSVVRKLPARMGADEMMLGTGAMGMAATRPATDPGRLPPGVPGAPQMVQRPLPFVQWNSSDQQLLYKSLEWEKPPTTVQVLLAQEELQVYGLLCELVARVNKPATGPFNAPIPYVQTLAVGYVAVEGDPATATASRIWKPTATGAAPVSFNSDDSGPAAPVDGAAGVSSGPKPGHPRFGGGGPAKAAASSNPDFEEVAAPVATGVPDAAFRNWIYVDSKGMPLTGETLETAPDAMMVHLMPFFLKVIIDQRKIDSLLVEMASSAVPLDVREIRINPGSSAGGGFSGGGQAAPTTSGGRPNDVVVELRGTVALATPPSRKRLELDPVEPPAGGEAKAPEAPPRAEEAVPPPAAPVAEPEPVPPAEPGAPAEPAPPADPAAAPAPEPAPPAGAGAQKQAQSHIDQVVV